MADEQDDELLLDTLADEQPGEPGEISIEIEGDDPPEETPLIKQLRQRERDQARELAELRRQQQPATPPEVGKKPDLWEDCEGDVERYDREVEAWHGRKQALAEHERRQNEAQQQRNHAFERRITEFRTRAAQLGVPDFSEAETAVKAKVPELLQNAVLQYAKDPAKVMYALYKHPATLDALLADGDPTTGGDAVKFILGIADLERNLKVVNRRKPPEPEADTIQRGSAPLSQSSFDKQLKKLEEDADRTGNRTKLIDFRRANKEKLK